MRAGGQSGFAEGGGGPVARETVPLAGAPYRLLPGTSWPAATAWWAEASDGIRLRLARWSPEEARPDVAAAWLAGLATAGPASADALPPCNAGCGSVLLFPGRTEYAEKYAPIAGVLTAAGLTVLAIDWRGQGASDRLIEDHAIGHVGDFAEYQRDVAAMCAAAEALDLPRPWHLLAHSMGGCIGLRALTDGLPVVSAAFSAPMWGIRFGPLPDPLGAGMAVGLARAAGRAGRGPRAVPGVGSVLEMAFSRNPLTSDLDEYIRLMREAAAWPDLVLGAASYDWVRAALAECRALARMPAPHVPALITLSGAEMVVSAPAIRAGATRWPESRLMTLPGARHEALLEVPATRAATFDAILRHFADHCSES
ncbi:alpha/beta hydrolase [Paracoccus suum]|uniref:Alpha/beta hydrolase n=1 Tax=Paracoccus suum TaxID=2259340 RepID=A0A344PK70_9RHOB|nr:alpha/beta hydrolase [Paracoccus suum]AXC49775.1 alpha/beta hydrolase [Paracoccus suum]